MLSSEGVELGALTDMIFLGIFLIFLFSALGEPSLEIVLRDLFHCAASLVYEVLLLSCARDLCCNT